MFTWDVFWWYDIPIASMYGIFTYIYYKNQSNVGKYTSKCRWIYHSWMIYGISALPFFEITYIETMVYVIEFRFLMLSSSLCRIWTYESKTCTGLQSRKLAEAIFTFFVLKFRGSAFCRILWLCLLHFIRTSYKDIVFACICNMFYMSCGKHKVAMILVCFW